MSIGKTTPEFLSACCRLLDLLDSPKDIPFLSGLIQREIIYRVLWGRVGARLRAVATLGDQSHRTAKVIAWITANYAKPLPVEELAELASMGVSTLHHHFRILTAMSPFQYQKQLRLQSARSLLMRRANYLFRSETPLAILLMASHSCGTKKSASLVQIMARTCINSHRGLMSSK